MNDSQRRIAEQMEGMMVVDAGPGTGKTSTIVQRYVNLISREDVEPSDVLLLTFTRNAATEMENRIRSELQSDRCAELSEKVFGRRSALADKSKLIRVSTFDAFCRSVLMDSPEIAGSVLGIEDGLTHGARTVENDTINREWFRVFFDDFLSRRGEEYGEWSAIACEGSDDILDLINNLMSRGVYPSKNSWVGLDPMGCLRGSRDSVKASIVRKGIRDINSELRKMDQDDFEPYTLPDDEEGLEEMAESIAYEDRDLMFRFIHDVYFEYIRKSVQSDRLTFGITSMMAFCMLYGNKSVRERNSYRYVMIDEFQDTNASQLMIALMILKEPNLCVVGDWKQGIYGFRYVSIENITDFEERVITLRRFLNEDTVRVPFQIPETMKLPLDINYRSSQKIIDSAYDCMFVKGTQKENYDPESIRADVLKIRADTPHIDSTGVRYCNVPDVKQGVVDCICEYLGDPKYTVSEKDGSKRPMRPGDIAVLCRKKKQCEVVFKALEDAGIPAFLQDDVDVMGTREGKLTLAWLRFMNNELDSWGYIPIMFDMGYSLADCLSVRRVTDLPKDMVDLRAELYAKRRRITDVLTTMFDFYGLNNDNTQTIMSILSTAHRDSLLTIADLVTMIEKDIVNGTRYPVEKSIDHDAVTIMTMHKSKGLEFTAVILPFINRQSMPSAPKRRSLFDYTELAGVRCRKRIHDYNGCRKIVGSFNTKVIDIALETNYDEERRLMFVAMSRAKQYQTLISSEPSQFMKELSREKYTGIEPKEIPKFSQSGEAVKRPEISGYSHPRIKFGVHELMDFDSDNDAGGTTEHQDEVSGKGKEYGEQVHLAAQMIFAGRTPPEEYPELKEVRRIIDRAREADLVYSEVDCVLPVEGTDVVLKGRIDLISVYEDHIEIHDYKTDVDEKFRDQYEFQLSVYAHAASGFYKGMKAVCFIDYVYLGRTVEFEPWPMDAIRDRVEAGLRKRENL